MQILLQFLMDIHKYINQLGVPLSSITYKFKACRFAVDGSDTVPAFRHSKVAVYPTYLSLTWTVNMLGQRQK